MYKKLFFLITLLVSSIVFPNLTMAHHYPDESVDSKYGTYIPADTQYQEYTYISALKEKPQSFTGKGVNIAVIDSGVDARVVKNVVGGATCINSKPCTNAFGTDSGLHGTHVSGIIVGDKDGKIKGIAPNANIYDVRILQENRDSSNTDFFNALSWIEEFNKSKGNNESEKIHIVNMSISAYYRLKLHGVIEKPKEENEENIAILNRLYNSGVLLIAASGNVKDTTGWGLPTDGIDAEGGVAFPARHPDVIAVGNFNGYNYNTKKEYTLVSTVHGEGMEIVAPGHYINSTVPIEKDIANSFCLTGICSEDKNNFDENGHIYPSLTAWDGKKDGLQIMTGTSMAAPVVSGTLALLKEKYPKMSNVEIRNYMRKMARFVGNTGYENKYNSYINKYYNDYMGYGLINGEIPSYKNIEAPSQITLMDNTTTIYNLPYNEFKTDNSLKPQTVNVVRQSKIGNDTWYEIQTWLGNRWIKPLDYRVDNFKMAIGKRTKLYDSINGNFLGATLTPQVLTVKKRSEGWFLVHTWLGDKWIQPEVFYKNEFPITLLEKTDRYDKKQGNMLGSFYPQTYMSVPTEFSEGWFNISNYDNSYYTMNWTKPEKFFIGNFQIELFNRENLYDAVNSAYKRSESLNPQTVTVIRKTENGFEHNDWFLIHTWIGDKWIQPKEGTYRLFQD